MVYMKQHTHASCFVRIYHLQPVYYVVTSVSIVTASFWYVTRNFVQICIC